MDDAVPPRERVVREAEPLCLRRRRRVVPAPRRWRRRRDGEALAGDRVHQRYLAATLHQAEKAVARADDVRGTARLAAVPDLPAAAEPAAGEVVEHARGGRAATFDGSLQEGERLGAAVRRRLRFELVDGVAPPAADEADPPPAADRREAQQDLREEVHREVLPPVVVDGGHRRRRRPVQLGARTTTGITYVHEIDGA